jgi:hypothetical protein
MSKQEARPAPSWEEYFKTKQDALNRNLGRMEATELSKYDPRQWDIYLVSICQDLLEIANRSYEEDVKLWAQIKQVETKLDKVAESHLKYIDKQDAALRSSFEAGTQDTAGALKAIRTWMRNWEPLLKLVREDYHDKLARVESIDEGER